VVQHLLPFKFAVDQEQHSLVQHTALIITLLLTTVNWGSWKCIPMVCKHTSQTTDSVHSTQEF